MEDILTGLTGAPAMLTAGIPETERVPVPRHYLEELNVRVSQERNPMVFAMEEIAVLEVRVS